MAPLLSQLRTELNTQVEPAYQKGATRFFKEEVHILGVRTPAARRIGRRYFSAIKERGKNDIFSLCEQLLETGVLEEAVIALDWAGRLRRRYEPADFRTFELWMKNYVTNWAVCDGLCTHPIGYCVFRFPEFLPRLMEWTRSRNRWLRRGAAVALIYPVRKRKCLEQAFTISDNLLDDRDDLVQKGYGWLLKEASNQFPQQVFRYVIKNKARMPRTALRYAIEKLPAEWRQQAMRP